MDGRESERIKEKENKKENKSSVNTNVTIYAGRFI